MLPQPHPTALLLAKPRLRHILASIHIHNLCPLHGRARRADPCRNALYPHELFVSIDRTHRGRDFHRDSRIQNVLVRPFLGLCEPALTLSDLLSVVHALEIFLGPCKGGHLIVSTRTGPVILQMTLELVPGRWLAHRFTRRKLCYILVMAQDFGLQHCSCFCILPHVSCDASTENCMDGCLVEVGLELLGMARPAP